MAHTLTLSLFHSLLPQALKLALSVSQCTDESKLEIAQQATILRDCLAKARKEVELMDGGELSLRDQEWLIGKLKEEVKVRQTGRKKAET
ncbi:hypothetical protein BT69DRAFT_1289059 [Atractiella rhizophila]|nr:hypothetical protein BT69DRAFT_1289686 [Atractiella rhizophila]KAH8915279.1 hypothetical protein BT69DRAFT_1289059 [Atractiella rhizophila]